MLTAAEQSNPKPRYPLRQDCDLPIRTGITMIYSHRRLSTHSAKYPRFPGFVTTIRRMAAESPKYRG